VKADDIPKFCEVCVARRKRQKERENPLPPEPGYGDMIGIGLKNKTKPSLSSLGTLSSRSGNYATALESLWSVDEKEDALSGSFSASVTSSFMKTVRLENDVSWSSTPKRSELRKENKYKSLMGYVLTRKKL